MQRKTLGTAILSLARSRLPGTFGLLLLTNTALSQTFDNFLFVGIPGMPSGTVTSLALTDNVGSSSDEVGIGQVSYFDASGLSSVYTLTARPSVVLSGQTPISVLANGSFERHQLSDFHNIEFFTGELTHETNTVPPNWFRLTRYRDTWSGVFRVGNQVYSLNRQNNSNVIKVRTTLSETVRPSPSLRARISAAFNNDYFLDNSASGPFNQVAALESIHVLDGLLSDSLGLTLLLEQVVVDNIFNINDPPNNLDEVLATAIDWRHQNQNQFGTDDKLAALFFVGPKDSDIATANLANQRINNAVVSSVNSAILQPPSADYQFATAHNFGKLLGLSDQAGTLQDWQQTGLVSLPAVHWSQQHNDEFDANLPAPHLIQVLNNDQPDSDTSILPKPPELDSHLIDSDSEEYGEIFPQDDPAATTETTSGGGSAFWLLLVTLALFRQPANVAVSTR